MRGYKGIKIIAIPYNDFKTKIKLTKMYLNKYHIEDLNGVLYMEKQVKIADE